MNTSAQAAYDRAWRHFQLHAEQRIAVFNFFVASSGLLLTGLAYVLAGASSLWKLGVAAGALVALLAFVFWKLDQRSAQIIKVSEAAIEDIERASGGPEVFCNVARLDLATSIVQPRRVWSFGQSFRTLFGAVAALGLCGVGASLWQGLSPEVVKTRPAVGTGPKRCPAVGSRSGSVAARPPAEDASPARSAVSTNVGGRTDAPEPKRLVQATEAGVVPGHDCVAD